MSTDFYKPKLMKGFSFSLELEIVHQVESWIQRDVPAGKRITSTAGGPPALPLTLRNPDILSVHPLEEGSFPPQRSVNIADCDQYL